MAKRFNKKITRTNMALLMILSVLVVVCAWFLFRKQSISRQFRLTQNSQNPVNVSPKAGEKITPSDDVTLFIANTWPQYPNLSSLFDQKDILRVFPFIYKEQKYEQPSAKGWLVEVSTAKGNETVTHYLVTPKVQLELQHVMTSSTDVDDNTCTLETVEGEGNEVGLGRNLKHLAGYLVLTGTCKHSYGGGNFVSVYQLDDGKKITLTGNNFLIPDTIWYGLSKTGNAMGRLRGVYGVNNPTIVVEYGGFESAAEKVDAVRMVGYFDLQTGKLKQLINFN